MLPSTVCASRQLRWPAAGRKAKKSLKIFLWVMTPVRIDTSMSIEQKPTIQ